MVGVVKGPHVPLLLLSSKEVDMVGSRVEMI